MRIRRIAILIDAGFFLKRLKDWPEIDRKDPAAVAEAIRHLCQAHVENLTGPVGDAPKGWLDHVYRLFFYDAVPYAGQQHHPLKNHQIKFEHTDEAKFRRDLFDILRLERKFALRLGVLKRDGSWRPADRHQKELIKFWHHASEIKQHLNAGTRPDDDQLQQINKVLDSWIDLQPDSVLLPLRQKGVDMKIGLDITTMALKKQVDTIILVTGDSDFVPAAKVARREGVDFILDPMWRSVDAELTEHIDGIMSGFARPART